MRVNRPKTFAEFQGTSNSETVERLKIAISAVKKRNEPLSNTLLFGNAGTGKTTIGNIIANEMNCELKTITGGTVRNHKDLWLVMLDIAQAQEQGSNKILFIDEVHLLAKGEIPEETYYPILEEYVFYHNLAGQDVKFEGRILEVTDNVARLEPFTIIGATTAPGYLSKPLRDRFQIACFLKEYSVEDIKDIVKRYALAEGINHEEEALFEIARRARGNPRVSVNFLLAAYDLMTARNEQRITGQTVIDEMKLQRIDEEGLTEADFKILLALAKHPKGLGLQNLSGCCGIEKSTIEAMNEPFLKYKGYSETRHRRFVTPEGVELLKRKKILK